MIQFREVSKSFVEGDQRRQVLSDLNLEMSQGQFSTLLGKSGSGKSTILQLTAGLVRPDSGQVWVDGHCLSEWNAGQCCRFRQQHLGFVFQSFKLLEELTVEQNVRLPLELKGISGDVVGILQRVGLADRLKSKPSRLSGGEQQRVAIARALVHSPKVILADEPTGNLDQGSGRLVLELLLSMVRERGATLLLVSHDRSLASLADRAWDLIDGKLHQL